MGQEISMEENARKLAAEELLKKIKSNQPEDLTSDNDFLGTISKGNMIAAFLKSLLNRKENDIQMIALYGEWGSGKTSLMQYVQSQLGKESFKPKFFEAWKLENDDNLSMSLLECILDDERSLGILKKEVWSAGKAIVKGLIDSTTFKPSIAGSSIVSVSGEKLRKSVDEYLENGSFSDKVKDFERKYQNMEDEILSKDQRLVVFVDDLDRCEPENVLNLLSAIKLFFTLGNRTIFICGLDKAAVDEAVKVKYKDVVKSGEYMEKIFDISFDMPKPNINKMIGYYFNDMPDAISGVQRFFEAMHFTNPRRIKKVLNKYLLLRYYKIPLVNYGDPIDKADLIPDQNIEFFRYLTLFIIILYKFEPDNFEMLRDYDEKLKSIKFNMDGHSTADELSFNYFDHLYNHENGQSKNIYNYNRCEDRNGSFLVNIITLFSPIIKDAYSIKMDSNDDFLKRKKIYTEQFSKDKSLGLPAYFCSYLNSNSKILVEIQNSDYRLWNIFDMAERYL